MDVAGQHVLGVIQNYPGVVGEDDLHLCAFLLDQAGVVVHIVNQGEGVTVLAEQLPVLFQRQHVAVGIDLCLIQLVKAHQLVAHLVGRIAEHQHDFLHASGDAPQADGEAVPGQDGENHTDGIPAQLGADIGGNGIHGRVVALGPGHHGLGDGDHVTIPQRVAFALGGLQNAAHHDLCQIVALTDNRAADASGYGSDFSFHR